MEGVEENQAVCWDQAVNFPGECSLQLVEADRGIHNCINRGSLQEGCYAPHTHVQDKILNPVLGWMRHYHAYLFTDFEDGAQFGPEGSTAVDMMHLVRSSLLVGPEYCVPSAAGYPL
jgi:hypothetical protein